MNADRNTLRFKKSSKSNNSGGGGGCVGLAQLPHGGLAIRDEKHPCGPILSVGRLAAAQFLKAVRTDELRGH